MSFLAWPFEELNPLRTRTSNRSIPASFNWLRAISLVGTSPTISLKVLSARLRATARRASMPPVATLQVEDLILDPASREVNRGGIHIPLTATEYRVLEHLMRRIGRASSRSAIIEAVWGFDEDVEANTVDAYIKLLRQKIETGHPRKLIHTVRGFGYILRENA